MKQYLGSINSKINMLVIKAQTLIKQGYNEIVIEQSKSFHRPETSLWMIKGKNNIDKLNDIYQQAIVNELALYGMSRKSDYTNIVNNIIDLRNKC
jgi:hypothetical protein